MRFNTVPTDQLDVSRDGLVFSDSSRYNPTERTGTALDRRLIGEDENSDLTTYALGETDDFVLGTVFEQVPTASFVIALADEADFLRECMRVTVEDNPPSCGSDVCNCLRGAGLVAFSLTMSEALISDMDHVRASRWRNQSLEYLEDRRRTLR